MEVDYQAKLQTAHLEVMDYFRRKNRVACLNGLQFDDQFSPNQEVEPGITHRIAFELQYHRLLPFEWNVSQREFYRQRFFVHRLQKSRPKNPMHFDRRANDLTRQLIDSAARLFHLTSLIFILATLAFLAVQFFPMNHGIRRQPSSKASFERAALVSP